MKKPVKIVMATLLAAGVTSQGLAGKITQNCLVNEDYGSAISKLNVILKTPDGWEHSLYYKNVASYSGDSTKKQEFTYDSLTIGAEVIEGHGTAAKRYIRVELKPKNDFGLMTVLDMLDVVNGKYNNVPLMTIPNFSGGGVYQEHSRFGANYLIDAMKDADGAYVYIDDPHTKDQEKRALYHIMIQTNRLDGEWSDHNELGSSFQELLYVSTTDGGAPVLVKDGEPNSEPVNYDLIALCNVDYW